MEAESCVLLSKLLRDRIWISELPEADIVATKDFDSLSPPPRSGSDCVSGSGSGSGSGSDVGAGSGVDGGVGKCC